MASGQNQFYCLWQDSRIRETLFQILSKEDICNVRLANSACCNLVTKRLFLRTHLTFTANSFTRPSKIQALSRIGHYIEHLTFYLAHSHATFLPPLIHPESGREISFLYTPHTSMGSVLERPKFASSGLGEILTSQYPPLFHAATNVPSFINAMRYLVNIRHLTIKTPGQDPAERYRRDIVDYALISLRVAVERAPLRKLAKLSLSSVHPAAFLYLRPAQGFGCSPSAGKRWRQIRKMHINVDSWDFYGPSPGLDHLKIIQDYLNHFSGTLEKLDFTWHGRTKGPCPIALAADPLFAPPRSSQKLFHEVTSPMSPLPAAPSRQPVVFRKLRYLAMRNATMNVAQVGNLVASHKHCVREFDFENSVLINNGSWDDALAPLMSNDSHSGYWTRHSMATITEAEDVVEPSCHSAAVAAVAHKLMDVVLDDDNDDDTEGEDESAEQQQQYVEDIDLELSSDVEAARQASIANVNKYKKRTVTKRRRRRKPGHERGEEGESQSHRQARHQQRHGRQESSDSSLDEPHERQPSNESLNQQLRSPPRTPHRQMGIPHQSSNNRLFGEVDSIYSSASSSSSRRLFGEITPPPSLSRSGSGSGSGSGSEPELTHDTDSGVDDEYSRPQTPDTPRPRMDISAPILDTSPNMPTLLLQPKVYDPTAELCSEITAVQRDLVAEEKHRLMAEDTDMQSSALRRAKELVLSRLGKEFGGGGGGRKEGGVSSSSFLASTRFREGLFGKQSGDTAWLYTRPSTLHTYLCPDSSGRPPWALITGASSGIGKNLSFELASTGFNIVLHGRNPTKIETVKRELEKKYPGIQTRTVIADGSKCQTIDFDQIIKKSLEDINLTILINCAGAGPNPTFGALESYGADDILDNLHLNSVFPALLTASLLPIMKNSSSREEGERKGKGVGGGGHKNKKKRKILIINIGSVTDQGFPMVSFYSAGKAATHALHKAIACEDENENVRIEVISHRIGHATGVSHSQTPPSLFQPHARTIARAILARTGCGRKSVVPYWPHALQQAFLGSIPTWMRDRVVVKAMREQRREMMRSMVEAAKKE
ncbi:hypothetical protein GGS20DRAFT_574888 [Poronia punctata]|nr:hypothetical protein GGS20DRAFT_574888 [Poronia punctata]